MTFINRLLSPLIVLTFAVAPFQAFAQEVAQGAPIYLDEPELDPPARVASRKTLKRTYGDKSIRTEREVARLSDDKVVSDGKYIEYYRDGQKYTEGNYKMGVFEGDWQYWFPNGQLCKKVSFKKGKPDGQWEVFDEDGNRTAQKSYQNGQRHGKWIQYYTGNDYTGNDLTGNDLTGNSGGGPNSDERPKFEISYDQGQPVGERITYFENGQKRQSIRFQAGKMDGLMIEWDKNGKKRAEATFKEGKLVEKIKRFNEE